MLEHPPRMYAGFLTAILAVVAWFEASILAGFQAAVVGSFALLMIVATGFCWADWLSYKALARYRQYREALAETERVRLIRELRQLQPFQADLLYKEIINLVGIPGSNGPIYSLQLGEARVPLHFIEDFFDWPDPEYLKPIREYPDKTNEREWAQALTAYLISMGFAEPANGNHSARWAHREDALNWLGLEE